MSNHPTTTTSLCCFLAHTATPTILAFGIHVLVIVLLDLKALHVPFIIIVVLWWWWCCVAECGSHDGCSGTNIPTPFSMGRSIGLGRSPSRLSTSLRSSPPAGWQQQQLARPEQQQQQSFQPGPSRCVSFRTSSAVPRGMSSSETDSLSCSFQRTRRRNCSSNSTTLRDGRLSTWFQ